MSFCWYTLRVCFSQSDELTKMSADKPIGLESRYCEIMQDSDTTSETSADGISSNASSCTHKTSPDECDDHRKLEVRHVTFDKVEIYYFERSQGFVCVPSQGGSTLGMRPIHFASEMLTVSDHQDFQLLERYLTILRKHAAGKISLTDEQLRFIKEKLDSSRCTRLRETFYRHSLLCDNFCPELASRKSTGDLVSTFTPCSDDYGSVYPSERTDALSRQECSPTFNIDVENQLSGLIDCYFLQLIPVKKRRLLLRKAGVKTIDHTERIECQAIRMSREVCGCSCSDGMCSPVSCPCALDGIRCQVDRALFPCSCVERSHCQNPHGRIEFDSVRVRTHYLHTRMRLDLESHHKYTKAVSTSHNSTDAFDFGGPETPSKKRSKYEPMFPESEGLAVENKVCAVDVGSLHSADVADPSNLCTTMYDTRLGYENEKYIRNLSQNLETPRSGTECITYRGSYLLPNAESTGRLTNTGASCHQECLLELETSVNIIPDEGSMGTKASTSQVDQEYRTSCPALVSDSGTLSCDYGVGYALQSSIYLTPTPSCSSFHYESHANGAVLEVDDSASYQISTDHTDTDTLSGSKYQGLPTESVQRCSQLQRCSLEPISSLFNHRVSSDVQRVGSSADPSPGSSIIEPDSVSIRGAKDDAVGTIQTDSDPIFQYTPLRQPETSTDVGNTPTEAPSRAASPYVETVSA